MVTDKQASQMLSQADARMKKTLDALQKELAAIRTGRARPSLVEHILVEYYGVPTPLHQMATITAPDARLLLIQPWDKAALQPIERAILTSDLGLNPANDGNVIRVPIPPLSEERRRELVKLVRKRLEEGRISLRNTRREGVEEMRKLEREGRISQDESKRAQDLLQKLLDAHIARVDEQGKRKETELMEV